MTFRSHLDGAMVELSPERAVEIQSLLGADIAMQLDECLQLPAPPQRDRARHAAVAALGASAASARSRTGAAARGARCSASCRAATIRHLRVASARALVDIGFRRLRHRRPGGRRAAGGHAAHDRGSGAGPAGRASALSHGRRHARRPHRGGRARHRHVRLRAADPQRPPRARVHALRADQSQECAPRRRSAPARCRAVRARRRATIRAPICIIW